MADDLDPTRTDTGTGDEDLLSGQGDVRATDDAQPDDEEGLTPFDPMDDEATLQLLHNDPVSGIERLKNQIQKAETHRNKLFSKRMKRIKEQESRVKQLEGIANQAALLDQGLGRMKETNPALYQAVVQELQGDSPSSRKTPRLTAKSTVDDLEGWMTHKMESMLEKVEGKLTTAYQQKESEKAVDAYLSNKPKALKDLRDSIIQIMSVNENFTPQQAAAAVNPKLFADLALKTKRRNQATSGGEETLNARTLPRKKRFTDLEEAQAAAQSDHGHLDLVQ